MKTIDAQNQSLGRVASKIAKTLMGKDNVSYQPNQTPKTTVVTVINASKMKISDKKKDEMTYITHTGYPGGQRERTLGHMIEKRGYGHILKEAVRGMLPNNKLRPIMLRNLTITD